MRSQNLVFSLLIMLSIIGLPQSKVNAQNYPPAQGPPLVISDNSPYYPVFSVRNIIDSTIQKTLDTVNAEIARRENSTHVSAHLSFEATMYEPAMSTTTRTDAPNENIVSLPFMIQYTVSNIKYYGIPYFSRNIFQDLNVYFSCNNWFTSNGKIMITTKTDRPYLDGESFGEQALNFFIANTLSDLVSQKLTAALPGGFSKFVTTPFHCNCLGLEPGSAQANYKDGEIKYDDVKSRFPISGTNILNKAVIQIKSIKRLQARAINDPNTPLYKPLENIQLSFYANQEHQVTNITNISENETRAINLPSITLQKPNNDELLVLIASIVQLPEYNSDVNFYVYDKNAHFGNGTQKIIIQKSYWQTPRQLPGGQITKPTEVKVAAYELTVDVHIPEQVLINSH